MNALLRHVVLGAMVSAASGAFIVFGHYWSVAPSGSTGPLTASTFLVFPFLASVVSFPIAVMCCLIPQRRIGALRVLIVSGMFIMAFFAGIRLGLEVRRQGFADLASRSQLLINAIKEYELKYKQPPVDLNAITPEFLPEIPSTGMGAYPRYTYRVVRDGYDGNPWILEVFTPSGFINFDKFIYYPLQNYPSHWCGQPLEPIRNWVYLHE